MVTRQRFTWFRVMLLLSWWRNGRLGASRYKLSITMETWRQCMWILTVAIVPWGYFGQVPAVTMVTWPQTIKHTSCYNGNVTVVWCTYITALDNWNFQAVYSGTFTSCLTVCMIVSITFGFLYGREMSQDSQTVLIEITHIEGGVYVKLCTKEIFVSLSNVSGVSVGRTVAVRTRHCGCIKPQGLYLVASE